ncbi:MAG: substrate-binding domain-containing protein [Eubacteriales bacterium]
MLKKLVALIVMVLVVVVLFATSQKPSQEQYKIMFIPKSSLSTFWKIAIEGFETAIYEYNVYGEVRNTDSEEDVIGQSEIVREAIAEDFDAIVISANSYEALAIPVREAMDAGLEVVVIDSDVNVPEVKVRVSTDNYNAGFNMGEKMAELMDYGGNIGVINYDIITQNGSDRTSGFYDAISQYDELCIVADITTPSDSAIAEWTTIEMIEANEDLDGVATFNEITTVGMGKALEELDRTDLICVGFDNNTEVIDYLEREIVDITVIQNQFAMGYLGVEYAIRLLDGENLSDLNVDTGTHVVTRDNMYELQTILFPFYTESE